MRRLLVRIAIGVAVLVTLVASIALWGVGRIKAPGSLPVEAAVVIPRGSSVESISVLLDEAGVIDNPSLFALTVKMTGAHRSLRAGEYAFPAAVSLEEVVRILKSGRTVVRRFTVPEGLTSAQILDLLREEPSLSGEIKDSLPEGALLPETYHYAYGDSRADLLKRMQTSMKQAMAEVWEHRAPNLPLKSLQEALVLASIIEKETAVREERARVAGVFVNRLEANMRLQSDPTVVYALTDGAGPLGRPLTRADWKLDSPYNTYAVEGLPPGPIANPGKASIEAAVNPERHDYLYFVADGTGGHAFAKTLAEHNRNVALWREAQQRQTSGEQAGGTP
jgi:UPF0755 protein